MLYRATEQDDWKVIMTTNFKESVSPLFFTFDNKNQVTGVVIGAHSPLVACTDVTQKFVTLYNIKAKKQIARAPIPAAFLNFPGMANLKVAGLSVDDQTRVLVVNAPAMPYIIPLGAKK